MSLFDEILLARGLDDPVRRDSFLRPNYERRHDPFLLPDMMPAVDRLEKALKQQDRIVIYGDYDIDGLTATTVLLDAFKQFGLENIDTYIPNRFVEGYGLTVEAVEKIAATGAQLIITVDCGSLSTREIERANELGVDVIVTDHHNVLEVQPPAVAVINPKRLLAEYPEDYEGYMLKSDSTQPFSDVDVSSRAVPEAKSQRSAELAALKQSSTVLDLASETTGLDIASSKARVKSPLRGKLYPFLDLPGVGVAFKLVQALQTRLDGIPKGQEKWLLDLVALGTVCDVVTLVDENRTHVYWGLKVLAKTRRPGLRALMAVAGVDVDSITARSLGFGLGPRMNAAGRLETAEYTQKLLLTTDRHEAMALAVKLDEMNQQRRAEQDRIFEEAKVQAEQYADDPVLVLSNPSWSHGIIGIVAAKILEKYQKPTFVLQELGDESKGSARSYGDFSAADAIHSADDIIIKGGGHKLAAGVTLKTERIADFRAQVNRFYSDSGLEWDGQKTKLLANSDVNAHVSDMDIELVAQIDQLKPFGNGNPKPVLRLDNLLVRSIRVMGAQGQHIKLTLASEEGLSCNFIAFSAPDHYFVQVGQAVTVWAELEINEWQGRRDIQGRIVRLELL